MRARKTFRIQKVIDGTPDSWHSRDSMHTFGWYHETADQLKSAFGVEQWVQPRYAGGGAGTHLLDTFDLLDRKRRRMAPTIERMNADLTELYTAMGQDDLFVFLADTVSPAEFEKSRGQRLREAIAGAALRGGTFLYLRPDQHLLERYANDWHLDHIPRNTAEFEAEINWFRDTVTEIMLRLPDGPSAPDAEACVRRQVLQFTVSRSLYWAAGFSLGMFQTRRPATGEPVRRMTVRVPGGYGDVWYLPEDPVFAYRFHRCISVALEEQRTQLAELEGQRTARGKAKVAPDVREKRAAYELIREYVGNPALSTLPSRP